MVLSFIVYSLTDPDAWAGGEVWAASCQAGLEWVVAGLRDGWAVHVLACGVAA